MRDFSIKSGRKLQWKSSTFWKGENTWNLFSASIAGSILYTCFYLFFPCIKHLLGAIWSLLFLKMNFALKPCCKCHECHSSNATLQESLNFQYTRCPIHGLLQFDIFHALNQELVKGKFSNSTLHTADINVSTSKIHTQRREWKTYQHKQPTCQHGGASQWVSTLR